MSVEAQLNIIVSAINEMKTEIKSVKKQMLTKEDLNGMATKDDIKNMATKDDFKNMATKDELKELKEQMATKDDIRMLQKEMERMNLSIEAILEDIKMLDDRTRPIIKIKNS